MDPLEVFAYWDSKENQPHLTSTSTKKKHQKAHCVMYSRKRLNWVHISGSRQLITRLSTK